MKDIMGIINLSENEENIKVLAYHRPIASIPMAGRYRVIDFALSNMTNAGIQNISIFTHGKTRSLMDHIGSGKPWDLNRKNEGLFLFHPETNPNEYFSRKGELEVFRNNMDFFKKSKQNYVLLSKSNMICNINLKDVFDYHKKIGADITIVYKRTTDGGQKFLGCDNLNIDDRNRVLSIGTHVGKEHVHNISMEMYILKKELFLEMIQDSMTRGDTKYVKQAILQRLPRLNVNAYRFNGYLGCINSTDNYFNVNMDLLDTEVSEDLFYGKGRIYTKVKDEPSTKYDENATVLNSLIANGCTIDGRVENSIISRGVSVKTGAVIKNSIIMGKCTIEPDAYIDHVVLDKNVHVSKGKMLSGYDKSPLVVKKETRL